MSSERGNANRKRAPKYQNKTAFKNNLHDTTNKIKMLNSMNITDTCERCTHILQWKITYKKYKPLSAPKTCTRCSNKTIKLAYRVLCPVCAVKSKQCPKCCKPITQNEVEPIKSSNVKNIDDLGSDIVAKFELLPERKKRTIKRLIQKGVEKNVDDETDEKEIMLWSKEELITKLEDMKIWSACKDDFNDLDTDSENSDVDD